MDLFQWDDSLKVNVSEIDGQHRKLVALINNLNDSMKQGKGKEVMGGIIGELVAYAGSHFATEERYFEKFKYPAAASHKREHADFVKKVSEFKSGFDSGRLSVTIEVMSFLKDWLKGHIQGTDKKYGPFFNANGLK
jgi:hemerythrin-like metal-binding protein